MESRASSAGALTSNPVLTSTDIAPVRVSAFRLGRRPELNGLRAIAIIAVMICHADEKLLPAGFIGVDFFFVLSGFLITALLIEEYNKTETISLKNFYMRRVLRLAPALLLLLGVYCIVVFVLYGAPKTYTYWVDALIVLFYSANWARAFEIHPPFHLGHAWSLSMEEQFYAIWPPLLYLLLRKLRVRWAVALATAAAALGFVVLRNYLFFAGYSDSRIYNGLDTRADALMIGCFLGVLAASGFLPERVEGGVSRVLQVFGLASMSLLIGLTFGPTWNAPVMFRYLYFAIAVLTGVVILDCVINPASIVKTLLSFKPLVWIGTVSYGLYLWHYPIYQILRDAQFSNTNVLVIGTVLTFVITTLSFYLLEQPFQRLKRRFPAHKSS